MTELLEKCHLKKKSGPERYLNDTEEAELVNFVVQCSKVGYARSRKDVLALVQQALRAKGKDVLVTGGWWESFKHRHPEITLRSAEPLAYARAVASDPAILDRYYDILEQALSQNDLMDKPCQIFKHHFLMYAPPARPLLLLLDGHSSHYKPAFVQRAAEEEIVVFCLPPHTTHRTQPLDNGCFGPLKIAWREECQRYCSNNPGRVVTRLQLCQLFNRAWNKAVTMENMVSGFRYCGVYPFNRDAQRPRSSPAKFDPLSLSKKTGLKYIPLYSPAKHPHCSSSTPKFSVKEVVKYQRQFEEGYDISNPRYESWIRMYHPEALHKRAPSQSSDMNLSLGSPLYSPPVSPGDSDVEVHRCEGERGGKHCGEGI